LTLLLRNGIISTDSWMENNRMEIIFSHLSEDNMVQFLFTGYSK